jgi:CheY-like chemotaxis protein
MGVDILLVDDDAVQGATRKAILERAGYSVRVAGNGPVALDFLKSPEGRQTRMVITDHLMPGMNGPEFVAKLRDAKSALPILVLSGYADGELDYESLEVTFRMKPFPPDQLIALVQYLLASAERRTA